MARVTVEHVTAVTGTQPSARETTASPLPHRMGIASLPLPPAKTQGNMFEEEQEPYSSNPDFGR